MIANDSELERKILVFLTLLAWMRAIPYFRIFKKTRYLIRIIIEVVEDMIPFLSVLFFGMFAYCLIFLVLSENWKEPMSFNDA